MKENKARRDKRNRPEDKARRNVRLYYLFRVLCTMNFVMPIFMLFLMDRGLSGFQVMVTQAVYTFVELVLTVPSGAFADKVGRKKTLLLSTLFYAVAFAAYGFVQGFVHVLLVEMVFAVSSALFHGTGEAFLYDTLAEAKQEKKYKKVLGTTYAIQSVMMGAAAVVGGLMAKHDLALPFFVSAVPVTLSVVPLLFLREPKRHKAEDDYWKLIKESAAFTLRHRHLRNLFYFSAVMTVVGYVGFTFYQPLLTEMGLKVEYLGVVIMLVSVVHGLGNKLAVRLDGMKPEPLLLAFAGFRGLLYLLVWLSTGLYVTVWMVLYDLVAGMSWPLVSGWVNSYSKSENRATINSLSSMSGTLAFTMFSPLLGLAADVYSTQNVYVLLAGLALTYSLRQAVVLVVARRAQEGRDVSRSG